jgi:hypothetical protein
LISLSRIWSSGVTKKSTRARPAQSRAVKVRRAYSRTWLVTASLRSAGMSKRDPARYLASKS